jgi:nicotinamide mononucleotide transporter
MPAPAAEGEETMSGWFSLAAIEWQYLLGSTPLEITATVCAVWGVFLIARQNIWGWPLGIVWAGISTWLAFTQWQLVSDGILYASYIPIQVYCWAVWARRGGAEAESPFTPTWLPVSRRAALAAAAFFAILLWGVTISELSERVAWIPAPALLWRDSTTTVLNYFAQFLQARKRMENWVGWLIVNLLGIHIYWVKDSPVYSIQYAFFLVLGLYGWWKWNQSIRAAAAKAAA